MSSTSGESVQSSDFDFCTPNYLNENTLHEDNMSSSSESSNETNNIKNSDKNINEKTHFEQIIGEAKNVTFIKYTSGYQAQLSTSTINNSRNELSLTDSKNKYIYHLPKSIAQYDFNKHKYSSKYRSSSSTSKKHSTISSGTNIPNQRKISLISERKYSSRLRRYNNQQKENILEIPKKKKNAENNRKTVQNKISKSSVQKKKFAKPMLSIGNIIQNQENDDSMNWETINESVIVSEPAIKQKDIHSDISEINIQNKSPDIDETSIVKQKNNHSEISEINIQNKSSDIDKTRIVKQKNNHFEISEINNQNKSSDIRMRTIGSDDGIWDVDKTCSKEVTMIQQNHDISIIPQNIHKNKSVGKNIIITDNKISDTTNVSNKILASKNILDLSITNKSIIKTKKYTDTNKLTQIRMKLMELHKKLPKEFTKQLDVPVLKQSLNLEQKFELARKDLNPNSVILNTSELQDNDNGDGFNYPLDLSKNHSKSSDEQLVNLPIKEPVILNVNQFKDFGVNTDFPLEKVSLLDYQKSDVEIIQNENLFKTSNTNVLDMEIEETHRDIAVENNNNNEKITTFEKDIAKAENKNEMDKLSAINDLIQNKVSTKDKDIEGVTEMKKQIEIIILDILEKLPAIQELQKKYFKDSLDYIIDEVYKKHCGKLESEKEKVIKTDKVVVNKSKVTKKPIAPRKNIRKKKPVIRKAPLIKNLKQKCSAKVSMDKSISSINRNEPIIKNEPDITKNKTKAASNNKIYESIEILTQTIKATLEEFERMQNTQKSDKIISKSHNNNSPDLFSNSNISVISNKFSATSTPFESNHYTAECLKGLGIMQKKIGQISKNNSRNSTEIITPFVTQKIKCTKQATLTQTFGLQKNTQANLKINENDKFGLQKPNDFNNESLSDDLYIDLSESFMDETEINNYAGLLEKVNKWKNSSDPWNAVEYDEPRSFDPNFLVMLDSSQVSTSQLPSNQQALKKHF